MAQYASLDAPIAGDAGTIESYSFPMEGNTRDHQASAPPPQLPPYYPPPKPARRWLPITIIVASIIIAAIIIATGAVTIAVIMNRGNNNTATTATTTGASSAAAAADSSTCRAWPSTKAALDAIPALPKGWSWNTPNIDTYIANIKASVDKELDLFEPEIADTDPPDVVTAARSYVSERHKELQKFVDHTYTDADGVPLTVALAKLDRICLS
jgi:type II secretory pathway pseudopilin PulG